MWFEYKFVASYGSLTYTMEAMKWIFRRVRKIVEKDYYLIMTFCPSVSLSSHWTNFHEI